ncbi:MAG: hypothetical protein EXS32_05090 [Opitutus sp.]|nr:hypothetical protein [Opitutus sp.]
MNLTCLRWPARLVVGALLAGCSTSPISRIDANRAVYESWPFDIQQAVLNGEVKVGMTPEMVELTLGKPSQIDARAGSGGQDEVWVYKKGVGVGSLLGGSGLSIGGGIGGVSLGSGRGGGRRSTNADEQEVFFRNGVVTRSEGGK